MAVNVIDIIKPKNNGTFPVAEAVDIKVTNDKRLDVALSEKASQADLDALSTAVAGKASQSDLTALSSTVSGKADKTALAETNATVANKANQSALEATNATVTTINSEVVSLGGRMTTAESNIATQTARIDEIASLPEGSTTGDAELMDIRIMANGATAATAGEAVRSQVNAIEFEMSNTGSVYEFLTKGSNGSASGVTWTWENNYCIMDGTSTSAININVFSDTAGFAGSIQPNDIISLNIDRTDENIRFQVFFYVNSAWDYERNYYSNAQVVVPSTATGMLIRIHVDTDKTVDGKIKMFISKTQRNAETNQILPAILPSDYGVADLIMKTLEKYGIAILGKGTYNITTPIIMPDNTIIRGAGDSTVLKASTGITCIKVGSNCTVENVKISSSDGHGQARGTTAGIWVEGNHENTPLKYNTKISNVSIEGFSLAGIYGTATGYWVADSISAVNCRISNCYAGILLEDFCEFGRFTNILCYNCYAGLMNLSGNNIFTNCSFSNNTVGVYLIGDSPELSGNNGHGALIGCTINHSNNNEGYAILARGITNGFLFDSCHIWYGKVYTETSAGIVINNCVFGSYNTNAEFTNLTTEALILLGCTFKVGAVFSGAGTTKVINCHTFDGTVVER